MKKVLFVANITEHIDSFHLPYMKWFRDQGWQVDVAANGEEPKSDFNNFYNVKIARNPYRVISNYFAYRELKKIIDREKYDIVSCHTPMGGVLGRLCSKRARKSGTKVVYTAHGFHFYNGASIINWLFYYAVEKLLARITDCIITINQEDYQRAKEKFESSTTKVEHIYGIGVDLSRFSPASDDSKFEMKKLYGYENEFVLMYLAEFIYRKNHEFLIKSMKRIKQECPNSVLVLAGRGDLFEKMKTLAVKYEVDDCVDFLGFRTDVPDLLKAADVVVSSSRQEGLPINLIEAMASGLPIIASSVRGQSETVEEDENGYLFDLNDEEKFVTEVVQLYKSPDLLKKFSDGSLKNVKKFSIDSSLNDMANIFRGYM